MHSYREHIKTKLAWLMTHLKSANQIIAHQADESNRFVEDLHIDALDRFALAINVEQYFNIELSEEEVQEMTTVGQLIDVIAARVSMGEQRK